MYLLLDSGWELNEGVVVLRLLVVNVEDVGPIRQEIDRYIFYQVFQTCTYVSS